MQLCWTYGYQNMHIFFQYFYVGPAKICVDHPTYLLGGPLGDPGFFVSCSTAMEWMGWCMRQSSANSLTLEVTTLGKSLIYIKNSRGPKTAPWGTPEITFVVWDLEPSTTTVCSLVFKKAAVQSNKGPCMPRNSSFPNRRSCGPMSKALEKSKMATSVWIPLSLVCYRSWRVSNRCVSHENFTLKPWFKGVKISYRSRWVRKCLQMMCSRILQDTCDKNVFFKCCIPGWSGLSTFIFCGGILDLQTA